MARGKFNFGHASKWDRQQMEVKLCPPAPDVIENIESMKREFEAKLAAAALAADEWIWVEGYKGTDMNMVCRNYQFEIGKQFDIPDDIEIADCKTGFHLCRDLKDVFGYYNIGDGHRFFRVRALVRRKDYENYGKEYEGDAGLQSYIYRLSFGPNLRDKLAAKSIQFLYELTPEEVFAPLCAGHDEYKSWDADDKKLAMKHGIEYVRHMSEVITLVELGYSEAFAQYLVENKKYNIARAVGSQKDLSMDMKVLMILKG